MGNNFINKLRNNPWIASTIILGLIVLVLGFSNVGITENVSKENAGENLVSFLNKQVPEGEVSLVSSGEKNGLYEVVIEYKQEEYPFYVTKDGEKYTSSLMPVSLSTSSSDTQEQEIPKSDNPKVELFVMTHCPYGTQAEKGVIPVFKSLGDKINSEIRFVHYFMHGEVEEEETYRQLCIREEQNDKYLNYLECFLEGDGNVDSNGYMANGNNPDICMARVGINKQEVENCVNNRAEDYYAEDSALSQGYGVSGSPTLVINGKIVSSGRSSSDYLNTICQAFNDAPEECSEELSSETPIPGFGWEGTGTGTGSC